MRQRAAGTYACFAVTVRGFDTAIGIFQIRDIGRGFGSADWGFAIGSAFWGTGVFEDGAKLVVAFAFDTLGVRRLEARAAVLNGRGNAALQKLGAVAECVLRQSLHHRGGYLDQVLYAIARRRLARDAHADDALADRASLILEPVADPRATHPCTSCPALRPDRDGSALRRTLRTIEDCCASAYFLGRPRAIGTRGGSA